MSTASWRATHSVFRIVSLLSISPTSAPPLLACQLHSLSPSRTVGRTTIEIRSRGFACDQVKVRRRRLSSQQSAATAIEATEQ